ncbi:AraC family transcriptional regulator [Paenibacillus sp. J5C_2022]|uniref:AraC family transcriptional regulator n=1 Tax=Paenibacillus sp. J5C2022 TaxID=2977129 RepID=UPI0021D1D6ED|nr:AraC family transcriptional regulator [Paenibacillus sp. J5C2022]MCU6712174.1 AraC family transcriptional regulator [Paenibacillus sp. J5C2022]
MEMREEKRDVPCFESKQQLNRDFPFKIIRYSSSELKQPMHTHDYTQIAYVLKGVCNHQVPGKSLTVSKGDIFVIAPDAPHSLNAIAEQEYEVVLLDFVPSIVGELLQPFSGSLPLLLEHSGEHYSLSGSFPSWLHIGNRKQPFVEQLLQDIQDEFEHREVGYEHAILLSLAKLLLLVDREYRRGQRKPAKQPAIAERTPIEEVKRYIYDNYSGDIPLEHGAFIANMAPAYFSHQFKKETGQTFVDFINEVRIERAKELILRGTHTITAIGFQVGFHHLSHFIRTFKKRCGVTPTEYKKMFAKDDHNN